MIRASGGPDFECMTEDGPSARHNFFVGIAADGDDVRLTHHHAFTFAQDADRFAAKVRQVGVVDLAHWGVGSAWDYVRDQMREANQLAAMGATEADLERLGLA